MITVTVNEFTGTPVIGFKLFRERSAQMHRDEILSQLARYVFNSGELISDISDEKVVFEPWTVSGRTTTTLSGSAEEMATIVRTVGFMLCFRVRELPLHRYDGSLQEKTMRKLAQCRSWDGCEDRLIAIGYSRRERTINSALMLAKGITDREKLQAGAILETRELLWVLQLVENNNKYTFIEQCAAMSTSFAIAWKHREQNP